MNKRIGLISACAHRLYLYRPELFDSLKEAGYDVTVFGPEPQAMGEEWLSPHGIVYVQLPLARRSVDPLAEHKAKRLLIETVKRQRIGLLYTYGIRFAPLANNAARSAGVPCMNVINGLGSLFITQGARGAVLRALVLPYIRLSLGYSSRLVFQNQDDRALFTSLRLGNAARYMSVRGSGVNVERFPVFPLPKERIFGYVSRLNPEKGIDELLRAFENVLKSWPDARLRLAGELDGIAPGTKALLDRLCAAGAAEYLGEISDVPSFLKTVRYFVFPSYREGTPRATLEAMSCGRPVITTDATGCRETVTDGENGLLVKARDERSLREAMLRFCEDDAMTERMGHRSREMAEESFDVFAVNRALIGEIQTLY
ncbi:MAG: glycosyltransferase family 4 protein [Clostridia bacterium]|nr:glycosyltransferase family 4 protein [Clostridia bacterium]